MQTAWLPDRIYTGTEVLEGFALLVKDDLISGLVPVGEVPSDYAHLDLKGYAIAPAFIDLQIYGGNGHLFSADPSVKSLEATYEYCLAGGCNHFLITIATNSRAVVSAGIDAVKEYQRLGKPGLLGLHLEGPYINIEKRGAHLERFICKPNVLEIEELIREANGVVKIMTLAPEVCDPAIVDLLQKNGIRVSAGHSNATYAEAMNAFHGGVKLATHLFNAMSPLQSRAPGMVGAIYDHPDVMCSMVADGIHTDFASVRISKKMMGERLFLITDAVTETNSGPYTHEFRENRFVMPDGTLSGSALTMMLAVKNCVLHCGIPLDEAIRMASTYPARALGLDGELGLLETERKAEIVKLKLD